ncbi:MAG: WG repeat-containing protein [Prolixibacteraceae bacterium]|nr:WG repeat-containing protein [Prolixibacteraceae bacterium]
MKIKLIILLLLIGGTMKAQIAPFYSATNDKYGYKDEKGKVIIEPKYELAYSLNEGMAAFRLNRKYGYVNSKGQEVIAAKYDHTWKFIGGYAVVQLGDKYGFIDQTGKEVIPLIYENAYNHHGTCCYKGQAHVKLNGKWKIIRIG